MFGASMRRIIYATIAVIVVFGVAFNIKAILSNLFPQTETLDLVAHYVRALAIGLGIILITYAIASTARSRLIHIMGTKAYQVSTLIKITGYIIAALAVVASIGADLSGLLAGGVVTGLILGLALQPILGNFFAGILVMGTKMVEIGGRVRILSTNIPYTIPILPAYKFFSADLVEAGFKGTVIDMNFFYTRVVTDEGRELKIPNMVLMNSAIIDYTPEFSKKEVINVRVELPLQSINPIDIEDRVRKALEGFEIVLGPYLNEQSDKDHVIVLIKIGVPSGEDWRKIKSEALKRLLALRKQLVEVAAAQGVMR